MRAKALARIEELTLASARTLSDAARAVLDERRAGRTPAIVLPGGAVGDDATVILGTYEP